MIKHTEIATYRTAFLELQNYICPLCGNPLNRDEAVLDHDHVTGYIRGALHSSCNRSEGDIMRAVKFSRSQDAKDFLVRLQAYMDIDYSANEQHPKHKNELIKRFKRLNKKQMQDIVGVEGKKADLIKIYKKQI